LLDMRMNCPESMALSVLHSLFDGFNLGGRGDFGENATDEATPRILIFEDSVHRIAEGGLVLDLSMRRSNHKTVEVIRHELKKFIHGEPGYLLDPRVEPPPRTPAVDCLDGHPQHVHCENLNRLAAVPAAISVVRNLVSHEVPQRVSEGVVHRSDLKRNYNFPDPFREPPLGWRVRGGVVGITHRQ